MGGKLRVYHHALNRGVIDTDKLHRVDLLGIRLAAEDQTNFLCDAVGRAFNRPGTKYLGSSADNNQAELLPFIAGNDEGGMLELSDQLLRVWFEDALVTRASVSSAITNGDFGAGASWTLASTSGQSSTIAGGKLTLIARAHGGLAQAKQEVTVAGGDQNVRHALRIVVDRGPVTFRCGSTEGGDEYIGETDLRTGEHSLAFTPTGNFWVQFNTTAQVNRIVDSITVESSGVMTLPTPWAEADLRKITYAQSLDVMFLACTGYKQQRIERRGDYSWSVCDYDADDGPFLTGRTADISLTPSVTEGNGTLTASRPFFTANHVGALFRLVHEGQKVDTYLAAESQFTPSIIVSGITETNFEERKFTVDISGTWSGTLRTQRSFEGDDNGFIKCRRAQTVATIDITANASFTNDDNDDNAIVYYRVGFEQGTYTSGEAAVEINYPGGFGIGICRVVGFTSSTVVDIEVLTPFSGIHATEDWREGAWSDEQGWPAGVDFHEGRLFFVGSDRIWGSVSDAYDSFDEDFEGDAGPLIRSIALGGRNEGRWLLSGSNLLVGCDTRLAQIRASSLDEILTPSNFGVHNIAPFGAASVRPLALADDRGLFVGQDGTSLYEITYDQSRARFVATQFSKLTTDLFEDGVTCMALQNRPDQRIWVGTTDGNAVCIVFEPQLGSPQGILAFIPIAVSSGDVIESIATLPGTTQDRVYFSVKRIVGGSTKRYIEKLALDTDGRDVSLTKCLCMDSYVEFGADGDGTIAGLDHLEGRTVCAWSDGAPVAGTFVVSGGGISLGAAIVTGAVVGLPYTFRYKSGRLAYGTDEGMTSMLQKKSVSQIGLLLADYVRSGVTLGAIEAEADARTLPANNEIGQTATEIVSGPGSDESLNPTAGPVSFDARVYVKGSSPKPMSILSIVFGVETYGP